MKKGLVIIVFLMAFQIVNAQLPEGEFAITATTTLPASSTSDFSPDNLMDGGLDSWSEGSDGNGIGEEIQLYTRYPDHLNYIMIKNGFGKERYWKANGRVRELKIRMSSGKEYFFELKDIFSPQVVGLYEPKADAYGHLSAGEVPYDSAFTFTIMDVYPGGRWEDLCITEIGLNQWYYDAFQMDEEY
ncbi:MAG TPA: hypothetical protein VJ951_06685, partial [Bacteroidales bacterium]|nr:hypothetical protein [Bacteroidales bacterium]